MDYENINRNSEIWWITEVALKTLRFGYKKNGNAIGLIFIIMLCVVFALLVILILVLDRFINFSSSLFVILISSTFISCIFLSIFFFSLISLFYLKNLNMLKLAIKNLHDYKYVDITFLRNIIYKRKKNFLEFIQCLFRIKLQISKKAILTEKSIIGNFGFFTYSTIDQDKNIIEYANKIWYKVENLLENEEILRKYLQKYNDLVGDNFFNKYIVFSKKNINSIDSKEIKSKVINVYGKLANSTNYKRLERRLIYLYSIIWIIAVNASVFFPSLFVIQGGMIYHNFYDAFYAWIFGLITAPFCIVAMFELLHYSIYLIIFFVKTNNKRKKIKEIINSIMSNDLININYVSKLVPAKRNKIYLENEFWYSDSKKWLRTIPYGLVMPFFENDITVDIKQIHTDIKLVFQVYKQDQLILLSNLYNELQKKNR